LKIFKILVSEEEREVPFLGSKPLSLTTD
jgi:hypothetical protein